MLKLFYAPGACSLASHIALKEAGADYEAVRVDLRSGEQAKPEYRAVNPKGKVPALATDRGVLTENPVILGYVAQAYPAAKLAPNDDSFAFGDMQAFNMFLSSAVHIAFNHVFRPDAWTTDAAGADAIRARGVELVAKHFALIEERLADGREWVHGAYTASDGYLYVFERWLTQMGAGDIADYPKIAAHRARMEGRPAVAKALADEGLAPM